MNLRASDTSPAMWMLGGFALGLLAMYMMDPDRGKGRRALVRDKAYSAAVQTRHALDNQSRDLMNRARGMAADARHVVMH